MFPTKTQSPQRKLCALCVFVGNKLIRIEIRIRIRK